MNNQSTMATAEVYQWLADNVSLICHECSGQGWHTVCNGMLPEHGNLEQESCGNCNGNGTVWPLREQCPVPGCVNGVNTYVPSDSFIRVCTRCKGVGYFPNITLEHLLAVMRQQCRTFILESYQKEYCCTLQEGEGDWAEAMEAVADTPLEAAARALMEAMQQEQEQEV